MATRKNTLQGARTRTRPMGSSAAGKITKSTVTADMVEERARELAQIGGREASEVTESDRRQAKRELLGPVHPSGGETAGNEAGPWEPVPGTPGTRTPRRLPQDDQITKELVEEGVDEAEHDQMVRATRRKR